MRPRAQVNGFAAIAMVDPGSEKFDFVSRVFLKKHQIPTYEAEEPIHVDLAGTGNKYLLCKRAKLYSRAKSLITGAVVLHDAHAFVPPMSRDDLIISMDNIVRHMIPLSIELLLVAQRDYNGSSFIVPGIHSSDHGRRIRISRDGQRSRRNRPALSSVAEYPGAAGALEQELANGPSDST